ncbi:amidase [Cryptosporangium arvum]|uniref:Amidase, Asp-tRNAAsn/Glu-tRNAGln amidotransferase A subunit n=1 Tax=Cryptosporangium arvum DSM 44712 TaxID=927661 RepID=A0A010YHE5_9ACTN|nr:amidase [Cryptosporangium arvum]EXG79695.1 amidase, Asp-tRNAAsn/Glu-tRNAGln amidotransferase A subunit [Cryptosporangium arvum DSM 44712]
MAIDGGAVAAAREFAERLHAAPVPRTTEPAAVFSAAPASPKHPTAVRDLATRLDPAGTTGPSDAPPTPAPPGPVPGGDAAPDDDLRTLSGAAAALRRGTVRSIELVDAALAAGDKSDAELGLFLSRFADRAREAAQRVDDALAAGDDPGPLSGLPLGIKDLLTTEDGPTSAGSLVPPPDARRDATAVARLRAAGGIVVGKTLTSEYGVGSPDPAKPLPVPRNPWDTARWTGGSSAGSAAGLVAGAFLGALGTDSGGSIRMPSAFCGTTGLKPTYGRVSRAGGLPMGWSTDHVGPMATTARDCALLLSVIAGPDPADPTTSEVPVPRYLEGLTGDLTGVRVGVDRLDRVGGAVADPALASVFAAALDELTALGAELVEVALPLYPELAAASIVLTLSEALTWHRADFAARGGDFFANTLATVGLAEAFTAVDYVQAQRVRRAGQDAVSALFDAVDLVVTPTASIAATPYDRLDRMFESGEFFAVYAPYWNVVGNPALSVPMGFTADRMPLGLQVIGAPFDEALVLRAGDAYQRRTGWHNEWRAR